MDVDGARREQGAGGQGGSAHPGACADQDQERGALSDGARARGEGRRRCWTPTAPTWSGRARPAFNRAFLDRLASTDSPTRGDGDRPSSGRRPARSCRRDRRGLAAAERSRDRAGSCAARRDRLHLRIASERDRRRGRSLPQVRQRCPAAWRQRGARIEHGDRADPGQGGGEGGLAGRRDPARGHSGSRGRPRHAHPRSLHRPHRSARRRGIRAAGGRACHACPCSSTTRDCATSTSTRAPTWTWPWRSC